MERSKTLKRKKKAMLSFIDEVASKDEVESMRDFGTSRDLKIEEVDSLHGIDEANFYRTLSDKGRTLISELDLATVNECVDCYEYLTKKGIATNLGKVV